MARQQRNIKQDVDAVVARVETVLPPPASWLTPTGYPDLARCILDSVWSTGVNYGGVKNVIGRYAALPGYSPSNDSKQLAAVIDGAGGPAAFADEVNNYQRTSTRNGILKAQAIREAAQVMIDHVIFTTDDLKSRHTAQTAAFAGTETAWKAIRGQGSGITWTYCQMLAGIEGVKPDRMIRRFVATALEIRSVDADYAGQLVTRAALRLAEKHGAGAVTLGRLDYAIWSYEREVNAQRARARRSQPKEATGQKESRAITRMNQALATTEAALPTSPAETT